LYNEETFTGFTIEITNKAIIIFRESRTTKQRNQKDLKLLYMYEINSIDLLPWRYATVNGNFHQWTIDCIP